VTLSGVLVTSFFLYARGDSCTEICLSRRRDIENELKQFKWDIQSRDEKVRLLEQEVQVRPATPWLGVVEFRLDFMKKKITNWENVQMLKMIQ